MYALLPGAGEMKRGVVWLDQTLDQANVNPAAAHLLGLPAGEIPAGDFIAAMRRLEGRALDRSANPAMSSLLFGNLSEDVDFTFCLAEGPTLLRVSSYPARLGAGGSVWAFEDVSVLPDGLAASEAAQALLRASADALLDPQVVLEAPRDSSGQIVDFRYREVNQATCEYLGLSRAELLGRGVLEIMPGIKGTLFPGYIRCVDTGEPVILDDFCYDNEVLHDTRRYDLRATRATATSIVLTWRDVTERVQTAQRIAVSERNYRLLVENAGDMVTHVRDGRFAWVSPSVESVLGAPASHWLGRDVQEIVPSADVSASAARVKTLEGGGVIQQRIRVVAVDGVMHWVDMHAKPFHGDDGRQDGFTAALRLVDEQVAAEQHVREARRQQDRADDRYHRSMDNAAIGMCLISPDGRFEEVNDALCQLFGYDAETLKHKTWQELTAPEYLEADLKNVNDVLEGRIDSYRMLKQYRHADGHPIWGDLAVSCIRDEHGQVENFISQITDMTNQVEAEQQLERLARFDTLTGLANRAEVIGCLESALAQTSAEGSHLGVLFCDVDHFKDINDTFGHPVGDVVLSTVASRIRQYVRAGDIVGRTGGDEILILLPGMYSVDEATRIAEGIRRHVAEPIHESGHTIKVTLRSVAR